MGVTVSSPPPLQVPPMELLAVTALPVALLLSAGLGGGDPRCGVVGGVRNPNEGEGGTPQSAEDPHCGPRYRAAMRDPHCRPPSHSPAGGPMGSPLTPHPPSAP